MYGAGFALPRSDSSSMRGCTWLVKAYGRAKPSCKIHLLCFGSLNESMNLNRGKSKLLKHSARQHDEAKNHFESATVSLIYFLYSCGLPNFVASLRRPVELFCRITEIISIWRVHTASIPEGYCLHSAYTVGTYTTVHDKNVTQPLEITYSGKCLLSYTRDFCNRKNLIVFCSLTYYTAVSGHSKVYFLQYNLSPSIKLEAVRRSRESESHFM